MFSTANDLMKAPITTTAKTTLHEIASVMETHRISTLPVMNDANDLLGVITKTDLVHFGLSKKSSWAEFTAEEAMNPAVIACDPQATLPEVARLMRDNFVHHILVVEEGKLVGVISSLDLAEPMLKAYEMIKRSTSL